MTLRFSTGTLGLCLLILLPGCGQRGAPTAPGSPTVSGGSGASGSPGVSSPSSSGVAVTSRPTMSDQDFAKTSFATLVRGDASAQDLIDWDTFQGMGQDVGKIYQTMPDENNKAAFRRSFIASFSKSFLSSGATAESLTHWRVQSQSAGGSVVAADTPSRNTLLITVAQRGGAQKMTVLSFATPSH